MYWILSTSHSPSIEWLVLVLGPGPRRAEGGRKGMILFASFFFVGKVRVGICDRKWFYAPQLTEELQCEYLRAIHEIVLMKKKSWMYDCQFFFGLASVDLKYKIYSLKESSHLKAIINVIIISDAPLFCIICATVELQMKLGFVSIGCSFYPFLFSFCRTS